MKNKFQCKALNNHKKTKTIVLTQVAQNCQPSTDNCQLPPTQVAQNIQLTTYNLKLPQPTTDNFLKTYNVQHTTYNFLIGKNPIIN